MVMLSRVAVASYRQRGAYSRAVSSSSRSSKSIFSFGGQSASDFDVDSTADFSRTPFASLRREAEKSAATNTKVDSPSEQEPAVKDTHGHPLLTRSSSSPVSSSNTSFKRNSQPNLPPRTEAKLILPEETGRKNPFEKRSRLIEELPEAGLHREPQERHQGWGPGLREKIADAQENEQLEREAGGRSTTAATEDFVGEDQLDLHSTIQARTKNYTSVTGRPCNDIFGFEKWFIFSKQVRPSGEWRHLFARRYRVRRKDATLLYSNIVSAIATTKAVPRYLSLDNEGQHEGKTDSTVHIELGGWRDDSQLAASNYSCPRFPYHRGMLSADGYAILQIESIIRMHDEMATMGPEAIVKPRSPVQQSERSRVRDQEPPSEMLSESPMTRRNDAPPPEQKNEPRKILFRQLREAPRRDSPLRQNSWSTQDNNTKRRDNTKRDYPKPPANDPNTSRFANMFGKVYGNKQGKGDSFSSTDALIGTVEEHAPKKEVAWPWTSPEVSISEKNTMPGSNVQRIRNKMRRTLSKESIDVAASVFGDGAQDKSVQSARSAEVESKNQPKGEAAVEEGHGQAIQSDTQASSPKEESSPVYVDGGQARDTATKIAQEGQTTKEESSTSIPSGPVEEATPVLVDGEQASATVAEPATEASEAQKSTSGVEESIPVHVDDEQAGATVGEPAGEASKSQEPTNSIEESTPVLDDEEQAKGTAATITDKGGSIDEPETPSKVNDGNMPEPTPSDSTSQSTSHDIDGSVPVAVEGDQVGKQQ